MVLFIFILLGTGLRLYNLGGQGIWHDEQCTLMYAQGKFGYYLQKYRVDYMDARAFRDEITEAPSIQPIAVVHEIYNYDPHPPLYYLIVNLFISAFGTSEFVLRLPSALFGILTIPFLFLLGSRLYNAGLGLIAAGLFALAPYQVYFAQEARMYSMVVFLSVLSTWLLLELSFRRKEGGRWSGWALWIAYILITTAGIYTQYLFVFILPFQFIFVLARHLYDRAFLSRWFLAMVLSFLAILPWLIACSFQSNGPLTISWLHGRWPIARLIRIAIENLSGFIWFKDLRPYKFKWLWIILFFMGLLSAGRRKSLWLLPLWAGVPLAATVFADTILGTHASAVNRYLILSTPPLYLLLALGLVSLPTRFLTPLLVGVLSLHLMIGSYLTSEGKFPPGPEFWRARLKFKEAGQRISSVSQPDDLVVMVSPIPERSSMMLAYHMQRPEKIREVFAQDITEIDWVSFAEQLRHYDQVTIVVFDLTLENPEDLAQSLIEKLSFHKLVEVKSYNNRIYMFQYEV